MATLAVVGVEADVGGPTRRTGRTRRYAAARPLRVGSLWRAPHSKTEALEPMPQAPESRGDRRNRSMSLALLGSAPRSGAS